MSKMPSRGKPELCVIPVRVLGAELGEAVGSIWPGVHEGTEAKGFRGNTRKDIKRMSRDNVREVGDHSKAVLTVGSLIGRGVNGWGRVRKSRGRVRT
jgi:hypothetical protein